MIYIAYKEITKHKLKSLNGDVSMFIKQKKVLQSITPNINRSSVTETTNPNPQPLKDRFLMAVVNGELGRQENSGVVVSLKEFKAHFNDIKSDYINSFLPAATIEPGQRSVTNTKYVFRVKKGVYLVHPEVLVTYKR